MNGIDAMKKSDSVIDDIRERLGPRYTIYTVDFDYSKGEVKVRMTYPQE